jgi:thiol-disulfide isomerase/thioredoxin
LGEPNRKFERRRLRPLAVAAALALAAGCAGARAVPGQTDRSSPVSSVVLPTLDGEPFALAQLRGEVILVSFFATWCFPCMVELPVVEGLQRDFGPRGFEVVAVGMDLEGRQVLEPFVQSFHPSYRVLMADQELREGRSAFGRISQLPTTVLLNRQGQVAAAWSGPADPAALRKLVAELVEQPR